jgi:outer membrane protein TolC
VEVAHLRALQAAWALETRRELLRLEIRTLMDRLSQQQAILTRYETSLLPDAREILAQAQTLYAQGEADYLTLALHTRDAVRIQEQYLAEILAYNQLVIRIQQLFGW